MFDFFMEKIQTQRGKQIVCLYKTTLDAPKMWIETVGEHGSGVRALINAAALEAGLMAMKCDTNWKSCVKFLNTWQLKLMDLEEIRTDTIIPDSQKRTMAQEHPRDGQGDDDGHIPHTE